MLTDRWTDGQMDIIIYRSELIMQSDPPKNKKMATGKRISMLKTSQYRMFLNTHKFSSPNLFSFYNVLEAI